MVENLLKRIQNETLSLYRSIITNYRLRHVKITKEKILIFIGSPRTGSTVLGQILNNHPECLISNESRLIQHTIIEEQDFNKELRRSIKIAYQNYLFGVYELLSNSNMRVRFQSKWKEFDKVSKPYSLQKKKHVKVVGDKKAGGAAKSYIFDKERMIKLAESHTELCFLNLVRNPIDTALSYMRSHPHEVKNYEEALSEIIRLQSATDELFGKIPNTTLRVYYEELLVDPKKELYKIFDWLNVDKSDELLNTLVKPVNQKTTKKIKGHVKEEIFHEIYSKL